MEGIFDEIRQERKRQQIKFGEQDHDPILWCSILGEEVGEVNKSVMDNFWDDDDLENYRRELIQVEVPNSMKR